MNLGEYFELYAELAVLEELRYASTVSSCHGCSSHLHLTPLLIKHCNKRNNNTFYCHIGTRFIGISFIKLIS